MQILSLRIKNFLSIADVEIRPGQVTQIVGKNKQGKTTILKAVEGCIRGFPDQSVVKHGEDSAEVIVELSDGTNIRRKINSEGRQSVEVKRDGAKFTAPQSVLDVLFDHSSFNPLELLDPKKRNEAILKAINIEVTKEGLAGTLGVDASMLPPLDYKEHGLKVIEAAHKYFYQRRAEANKVALDLRNRFLTYKKDLPKIPTEPELNKMSAQVRRNEISVAIAQENVSVQQINNKISARAILIEKETKYETELAAIESTIKNQEIFKNEIEIGRRTELEQAERDFKAKCSEIEIRRDKQKSDTETATANQSGRLESGRKALADLRSEIPDIDKLTALHHEQKKQELKTELQSLDLSDKEWETIEAIKKQHGMVATIEGECRGADTFADKLDKIVTHLHGPMREALMAEAELPVSGLEYKGGEFFLNGSSVDNLSGAEALGLAVGVARKLAKKSKVICIDGAEALDDESYKALREQIDGDGFTYFITKVGAPFESQMGGEDQVLTMEQGQVIQ